MFEHKRFLLETISDIHIGNGEKLNKFDYLIFNKKLYVISEEKLAQNLEQKMFNDFLTSISVQKDIQRFFERHNLLKPDFLERISKYVINVKSSDLPNDEIILFIKNYFYKPYIPGSTIKGFFRTAFLYSLVKDKEPDFLKKYVDKKMDELNKELRNAGNDERRVKRIKRRFAKEFAKSLEQNLLQQFNISKNEISDPNKDIFRVWKFSDSTPFKIDDLVLTKLGVFSEPRGFKEINIFLEVIKANSKTEFSITFDKRTFLDFMNVDKEINSKYSEFFENPERILSEFTNELIKEEKRYFERNKLPFNLNLEENRPNARIGFGTGLLSHTLDILLPPDDIKNIRNTFSLFRKEPAPKSRRIEQIENIGLGWVKIKEIKTE